MKKPSQQEIPGIWQFQGGGIILASVRGYFWSVSDGSENYRTTRDEAEYLDVWVDDADPIQLEFNDDPNDFILTLHLYWETRA